MTPDRRGLPALGARFAEAIYGSPEGAILSEQIDALQNAPPPDWEMMCPILGIPCGADDCLARGCIEEREPA